MGRKTTLHKGFAESVTVAPNTAGTYSPIITIEVPRSRFYTFRHGGDLILKLRQTGGAQISAGSSLVWTQLAPSDVQGPEITGRMTYRAWFSIPLEATAGEKIQYDVETSARRRITFRVNGDIRLAQEWRMRLLLNSPDVVDWDEDGTDFEWDILEDDVQTQVAVA